MAQKRLTFTVEEETYREIAERLADGETVDDWVREAIDERLDPTARDTGDRQPLEFVDDCAI